ncbi:uncharacterized protein BKA78DRAFT_115530 [Phyllosticta capitalensis]|uniref:uncharacterized protein n=1 Tax=Phyllosticta capitalensis TaxID=121624 RepID=UPI003132144D
MARLGRSKRRTSHGTSAPPLPGRWDFSFAFPTCSQTPSHFSGRLGSRGASHAPSRARQIPYIYLLWNKSDRSILHSRSLLLLVSCLRDATEPEILLLAAILSNSKCFSGARVAPTPRQTIHQSTNAVPTPAPEASFDLFQPSPSTEASSQQVPHVSATAPALARAEAAKRANKHQTGRDGGRIADCLRQAGPCPAGMHAHLPFRLAAPKLWS